MRNTIQEVRQAIRTAKQDSANCKRSGALITPAVREIAKNCYDLVKSSSKDEIFSICDELLESGQQDEKTIAFEWAFRIRKQYQSNDFYRFKNWLEKYVEGWGNCDDFCTHAFGHLLYKFPEHVSSVKAWTQSENRWFRRGAAVVMIYGIRRKRLFESAFEIADLLLMDEDDLVQKGYGWMLKEISNKDPKLVFNFVMQRKHRMPRTALRYAIEKLDPKLRHQAMEKKK